MPPLSLQARPLTPSLRVVQLEALHTQFPHDGASGLLLSPQRVTSLSEGQGGKGFSTGWSHWGRLGTLHDLVGGGFFLFFFFFIVVQLQLSPFFKDHPY